MSDPYERTKAGRLTFKEGDLPIHSKSIEKKKKKKQKKAKEDNETMLLEDLDVGPNEEKAPKGGEVIYMIEAVKKMTYEQLFPVVAKKFKYDPKSTIVKSVEDALDDRVKKKADRYCHSYPKQENISNNDIDNWEIDASQLEFESKIVSGYYGDL
ncbi:hypothetical protein RJ641_009941 [Dillenia turbinata]|uniref:Uncharacterized protein n=1 Tax=Dillenia turbinata TaxID=194707 RepID=A0AAN8V5G7_9MAGN